jgi:hypothetical protein
LSQRFGCSGTNAFAGVRLFVWFPPRPRLLDELTVPKSYLHLLYRGGLLLAGVLAVLPPARMQAQTRVQSRSNARGPGAVLIVKVTDEHGAPLDKAHVTVGGMDYGDVTDGGGNAKVGHIPPGNRLIVVSHPGYHFSRTASDFEHGDTIRREFHLTVAPIELEGITATSWGRSMYLRRNGFYDRQRRGFGAFMGADRVDELRPLRTTDLFRYMRGFMVSHDRSGHEVVVSSRGGGLHGCVPQVWIDGMMMFVRDAADQEMALNMVPPQDVEGIEAFAGASTIPAEFNISGRACGVILVWSKRD